MTQQDRPWLSVVIPTYDEARRIPATLRAIDAYARRWNRPVELIVVDDGSSDRTVDVVRELGAELSIGLRLLRYAPNRGKEHAEVAIGSRKMDGASIQVRQSWLRERMGKAFTFLVRQLIADVSDVTCGFKAFRGDAGRDLFARCRIYDWSFDAELLHIAQVRNMRVVEVPVVWCDQEGTKVRLVRDSLASLRGLARIRWNALRGVYRQPEAPAVEPEELPLQLARRDRPASGTST